MSAAASIEQFDDTAGQAPAALSAIVAAEHKLADLFRYAGRLHDAGMEHDAHSCVLCFEQR
jgi:hypothetical protein